jgi:hypothetical protein
MKVIATLEKQPCPDPDKICVGCFLRVGVVFCANRAICPNTKEENVNRKLSDRVEPLDESPDDR